MKKGVLISIVFIFLFSTFYVYSSDYDEYFYYSQDHEMISRTFHITHDNGRDYDRTFTNYNKLKKDYDSSKTDFEKKGIYLDYFDTKDKQIIKDKIFFNYLKPEKEVKCPKEWTCFK